jgi:endoglucanase
VRGFFTNDTHIDWTSKEIKYGQAISKLTGGAHFIVNTAQNGQGPKLNPHPKTQGIEDLCNPPGRGLGPKPTTSTGYADVDAFLWTHVPGNSSGTCNGGPASGVFWPARAIQLAANANQRLGPGDPSRPY